MIGERSAWGKGYATDAVRVRTRFAFGELGLHRIEGHTMNPAMKRVYEKCGYQHEGVARRKFWRDGRWHRCGSLRAPGGGLDAIGFCGSSTFSIAELARGDHDCPRLDFARSHGRRRFTPATCCHRGS